MRTGPSRSVLRTAATVVIVFVCTVLLQRKSSPAPRRWDKSGRHRFLPGGERPRQSGASAGAGAINGLDGRPFLDTRLAINGDPRISKRVFRTWGKGFRPPAFNRCGP